MIDEDPNADLIGVQYASEYRGTFGFTTTVIETAPWNPAYVNVDITILDDGHIRREGEVIKSSRRAEHVRLMLAAQPAASVS